VSVLISILIREDTFSCYKEKMPSLGSKGFRSFREKDIERIVNVMHKPVTLRSEY